MQNSQKTLFDSFKTLWEGGKVVCQYNKKIGYHILLYVVTSMVPRASNYQEKNKTLEMIKELEEYKKIIPIEDTKCELEEYQTFINDFFVKVDNEDRFGIVSMKTAMKFKMLNEFIKVLNSFGPENLNDEMKNCQKYCKWKAINIVKSLKKGEIPHRGGPNEKVNDIDDEPKAIKLKNEDDIPQIYLCPISYQIMTDPVITPYGISYDRKSIEKWLNVSKIDPIAHKILDKNMLIPNYALKTIIEEYKNANKI